MGGADYRNEYVNIACFSSLTRRVTWVLPRWRFGLVERARKARWLLDLGLCSSQTKREEMHGRPGKAILRGLNAEN